MAQDSLALPRQATPTVDPLSSVRKSTIVTLGILAGLAVAILWSSDLVDNQIGENAANGLLGYNAKSATLTGGVAGALFAFVAGLAGTFTACNIAAFSAVGPMMGSGMSAGDRARKALAQVGWLSVV